MSLFTLRWKKIILEMVFTLEILEAILIISGLPSLIYYHLNLSVMVSYANTKFLKGLSFISLTNFPIALNNIFKIYHIFSL